MKDFCQPGQGNPQTNDLQSSTDTMTLPQWFVMRDLKRSNAKCRKHTIFRLDAHYSQPYLCAVTFNNNDYGKRKSKLSGGI